MANTSTLDYQEFTTIHAKPLLLDVAKELLQRCYPPSSQGNHSGLFVQNNPDEVSQLAQEFKGLLALAQASFGATYLPNTLIQQWIVYYGYLMRQPNAPMPEKPGLTVALHTFKKAFEMDKVCGELHGKLNQLTSAKQAPDQLQEGKPSYGIPGINTSFFLESLDYLRQKYAHQKITHPEVNFLFPFGANPKTLSTLFQWLPKNRIQQKYRENILVYTASLQGCFATTHAIQEAYLEESAKQEVFKNVFWTDALSHNPTSGIQKGLFKGNDPHTQGIYQSTQKNAAVIWADLRHFTPLLGSYPALDNRLKKAYRKYTLGKTVPKSVLSPLNRALKWIAERLDVNGIALLRLPKAFFEQAGYAFIRDELQIHCQHFYLLQYQDEVILWMLKLTDIPTIQCYFYKLSTQGNSSFEQLKFSTYTPDTRQSWLPKKAPQKQELVLQQQTQRNAHQVPFFSESYAGLRNIAQSWPLTTLPKQIAKTVSQSFKPKKPVPTQKNGSRSGQLSLLTVPAPLPVTAKKSGFEQKRLIKSTNAPFQQQWIYWHEKHTYQSNFYVEKDVFSKPFPAILLGKQGQVWISEALPGNRFFPGLTVFPLKRSTASGSYAYAISPKVLDYLKETYEAPLHETANLHQEYLTQLFDFSDFEHCQVDPELAQEVRKLIQFGENHTVTEHLFKYINHPQAKTEDLFRKFAHTFRQVHKTFQRIGKRTCRSKASFEVFQEYFRAGEQAVEDIQDFYLAPENRQLLESGLQREITEEDVMYFVYALFHEEGIAAKLPEYLQANIPLDSTHFSEFWPWVAWGKALAKLHLHYEELPEYPLKCEETSIRKKPTAQLRIKVNPETHEIVLNYQYRVFRLYGFPAEVWSHRWGKKPVISYALEAIRQKYLSYEAAFPLDEFIAELHPMLAKVTTLSQETQRIVDQMKRF